MSSISDRIITIPVPFDKIQGTLLMPDQPVGLVIVPGPQNSGGFSSMDPGELLRNSQLASLSIDLLSTTESENEYHRMNIELNTERLITVTHFLQTYKLTQHLHLAYFARGTAAASALRAAAGLKHQIKAIATIAAMLESALSIMYQITAPTLLITAEKDRDNTRLNKEAFQKLTCEKQFMPIAEVENFDKDSVHGNEVAVLAVRWLKQYLAQVVNEDY